ncbi:MAG: hypothetical protein ACRD6N_14655 [Pyrinomonadaceae bacterium]
MAIANELSGDIAAAILATKKRTPGELSSLKETVLKVHSILQQMADETRRHDMRDPVSPDHPEGMHKACM